MRAPQFQSKLCAFFLLLCCVRGRILAQLPEILPSRAGVPETIVGPVEIFNGSPGGFQEGYAVASLGGVVGIDAKFEISHPYTVSLRRRSDLGYFCGGVLVGKRYVLTAAHCVDSSRTSTDSRPEVVVDSASSSEKLGLGVQVVSSKNVYIHPEYRSRRAPDLALVELVSDAKETPVQLPQQFVLRTGNALEAIGWGRQSSSSGNSELVQIASMNCIWSRRCAGRIGKPVYRHQICMGGEGVSSCEGDNGGPIVLPGNTREDDVLVGIMGSSHVCGKSSRPDIHTNIWPYISWIKSTAGIP